MQQTPADNEPGMVVTDTFYDSRGQVVKSSGPYYVSGVVPSATVYETKSDSAIASQTLTGYDGQGRVTKSVFYSDAVRQWETDTAYPGMNETDVTPPAGGTATSSFTNALGQVTASWMYSGSVTPDGKQADADVTAYAYTPAGQVASVTDGNQNVTSFTYDLLGRKAQEVSPDSGTTNWGYDAAGNVQSVSTGGGRLPTPTTA